jgi:ribosome maturation factor RimP
MGFGPFFVSEAGKRMSGVESKIEPAVTGMGYELVDVQVSNGGRMLRVFIDKSGGINVDDCAAVSRQLTRVLPVEGIDFERLEVSSPGLDRPLRKAADFSRFAGQKAELRMRTPDATGRRKFVGVLRGAADGRVTVDVDPADGGREKQQVALALDDIDRAKLIPAL